MRVRGAVVGVDDAHVQHLRHARMLLQHFLQRGLVGVSRVVAADDDAEGCFFLGGHYIFFWLWSGGDGGGFVWGTFVYTVEMD